jgi:hypothetical protein
MTDLFAVNGNTSEYVETFQNYPNSPSADEVVEITPDRGLFLRIANAVKKTTRPGVPVYMKLRDANGNHLPANTSAWFSLELQGMEEPSKVANKKGNMSFYLSNDLTTQRDVDNVDGAVFELTRPESEGGDTVSALRVRDIDSMYFKIDSDAQIDWSQSEFYIDSEAVEEGSL